MAKLPPLTAVFSPVDTLMYTRNTVSQPSLGVRVTFTVSPDFATVLPALVCALSVPPSVRSRAVIFQAVSAGVSGCTGSSGCSKSATTSTSCSHSVRVQVRGISRPAHRSMQRHIPPSASVSASRSV